VWQSTAIGVASADTGATLQVTRRNPTATWTSALARQIAADRARRWTAAAPRSRPWKAKLWRTKR
jgi:hypothetical protein